MLFGEQPTDPWTRVDRKLLESYQALLDEKCGDCGRPIWLCHSENSNLLWEVQTQTCYATKALQEWHEQQSKSKSKKKTHGQQPVPVPYMLEFDEQGNPQKDFENLPTREAYFKKE